MSKKTKKKAPSTALYGVFGVAFLLVLDARRDVWTKSTSLDGALGGFKVPPATRAAKLRGLEKAGVVRIRRAPKDPRGTLEVNLTSKGRQVREHLRVLAFSGA